MNINKSDLMLRRDKNGIEIEEGDMVKLPNSIDSSEAHPDYVEAFNKLAGQTLKVVGWDKLGFAWVDIGNEVISIDPKILDKNIKT